MNILFYSIVKNLNGNGNATSNHVTKIILVLLSMNPTLGTPSCSKIIVATMTRSMSKVQQARTDSEQRRDTRTLLPLDKYCDHRPPPISSAHFWQLGPLKTREKRTDYLRSGRNCYSSSESRTRKCLAWFCLGPCLRRLPGHFYPR